MRLIGLKYEEAVYNCGAAVKESAKNEVLAAKEGGSLLSSASAGRLW